MDNMNPNVSKKSSICRYFAADGICFYGEECQFVHSMSGQNSGTHTPHPHSHHRLTSRPIDPNISYNTNYHNNDTITPITSLSNTMSSLNIDSAVNKGRKISNNNGNNNTHSTIQLPADSMNSSSISSQSQSMMNYFVSESIKQELIRRQSLTLDMCQNGNLFVNDSVVDMYEDLCSLESSQSSPSSTFNGMITSVYRGTNIKTGQLFTLRRVHGFQPNTANAKSLLNCIESWKKLQHSNIVQLKQVFTTKAFGDNSVVFVYDYHVGAETLMTQYFANTSSSSVTSSSVNGYSTSSRPYSQQQSQRKLLPEALLWNYIIQLSSALRTIHSNGLASRAIDPTKVIITSGCAHSTAQPHEYPRLRLSGCGVFDVLTHESFLQANNPKVLISHFQQEDLVQFGKLCLVLACNSLTAGAQRDNWQTSLELISRNYSTDLRSLIIYLLSYKPNSGTAHTINDIMPMIGARFYTQLDSLYQRDDTLVDELIKEIDNGRLLRLLTKLGSINERPEFQMDPNWSETGDRYMLKLFRDYLFHQLSEDGRPWIELGHIVTTLNKLDIGSQEKICLISRDEQNILIVSFLELKRCLDSSLNELMM